MIIPQLARFSRSRGRPRPNSGVPYVGEMMPHFLKTVGHKQHHISPPPHLPLIILNRFGARGNLGRRWGNDAPPRVPQPRTATNIIRGEGGGAEARVRDEGKSVLASPGAGGASFPQCSVKMASIEANNSSFEAWVGKGARIIEGSPFGLRLCVQLPGRLLCRLPGKAPSRVP